MLGRGGSSGTGGTKNQQAAIKILPGHVARVRVRCGKANCRCARSDARHVAYYHVWRCGRLRFRRYVRRAEVEATRAACEEHRRLQAEIREGRAQYARTLAAARSLFRSLGL